MVKRAVSIIGDTTSTGGVVQDTDNVTSYFMGQNVANIGDSATCPICKKGMGEIIQIGNRHVQIEGKKLALENDIVACGCPFGSNFLLKQQDVIALDAEILDASQDDNYKHLLGRPSFDALADAYDEIGSKSANEAYDMIGGNLADLHDQDTTRAYENSCAARMSYAFNNSGNDIPSGTIDPNKDLYRVKGGDGKPYMTRVDEMQHYLNYKYGEPDLTFTGGNTSAIEGKRGIMSFDLREVRTNNNYTGHISLWDGSNPLDSTTRHLDSVPIKFWELP